MTDTNLSDTLAALSEAATQGEWLAQATDTDGPDYGVCIVAGNLGGLVGAALPWPTEIDSSDFSRVEANAAFIVALVNAYRTGQLVPVPSVERVADAIEACMGPLFGSPEYLADPVKRARAEKRRRDGAVTYATAVIAAMQEGRE